MGLMELWQEVVSGIVLAVISFLVGRATVGKKIRVLCTAVNEQELSLAATDARLSKRIDRSDAAIPVLLSVIMEVLDAAVAVIIAVERHELNGEVEKVREKLDIARTTVREFVSDAAVSQKRKDEGP